MVELIKKIVQKLRMTLEVEVEVLETHWVVVVIRTVTPLLHPMVD